MKFNEWYNNNWNNIVVSTIHVKIKKLFSITSIPEIMIDYITNWVHELDNLTLLYSEAYVNNFILNEVYDFMVKNYFLYKKLASFETDGGFGEIENEDIKDSYSVGGFDLNNQDLATGALKNDHSSVNKNKISNLDVISKLRNLITIEKDAFLNKIKECLIILW